MRFEVSERITTKTSNEELLRALEEQFRKVSENVQRNGNTLFVKSVEASFGSINRRDSAVIELKKCDDGYLAIAAVNYRPSVAFWILLILLISTAVGWVLPIIFYLTQRKTVQNAIQEVFTRVKNEFQNTRASSGLRDINGVDQIERLAALRDKKIISEEEFLAKKKEILDL